MTKNIQGFTIEIAISTAKARKKHWTTKLAYRGSAMSNTTTSLENLVMILPIGFESKNSNVARRTFLVISLCISVVLFKSM
jgi:hypothetical protein